MKKLEGGMRLDELPTDQVEGSWRWAKNKTVFSRFRAISDETGADDVTPFNSGGGSFNYPTNKKNIGVIKMNEDRIMFFGTTNPADSEIGIIRGNEQYFPIIKDSLLNFNQNFPISGAYEIKFNDNIIIAFTDFNDYPKILNISCIPFGIDPITFAVVPGDIDKAKVFLIQTPPYNTPIIDPYDIQVKDGGGSLLRGAYYPICQYELLDGTVTSWSKVYNGVPVFLDNLSNNANTIQGDLTEITTNKSIEITFTNVDINYKKLRIGYIFVSGGITTTYSELEYIISSLTLKVSITGSNRVSLTLNEVLTPNTIYKRVKTITSLQGKLEEGNVEEEIIDLEYQTYANLINVKWVKGDRTIRINNVTAKAGIDLNGNLQLDGLGDVISNGTYQDGARVFFDKTFRYGEPYALYLRFKLKNGNYSKDYHIPGRDGADLSPAGELVDPIPGGGTPDGYWYIDGGNPIYNFQINDTSTIITPNSTGLMGLWKNENEFYPLDPANPANIHPDFANIPGISLINRYVRHHVFPTMFACSGYPAGDAVSSGAYPTYLRANPIGIEISNVNIPVGILDLVDSYEIVFAERSNSNIRIIADDCIMEDRFHSFDLLRFRPTITPSYIRSSGSYRINKASVPPTEIRNFVEYVTQISGPSAGYLYPLREFIYVGENTTIPVNNTNKADSIYFESASGLTPANISAIVNIDTVGTSQYELFDICIYRRNMYVNFQTQTLVSTGASFKITASGVQSAKKLYGGDCYINRHSFVDSTLASPDIFSLVVSTASNIGLRSEDLSQGKLFYPRSTTPTPSWYGYNADYNCVNTFNQQDIHYPSDNCTDIKVTKFPFRIAQSLTDATESSSINWRIFKVNSYYDMPRDKGEIWCLTGNDRTLFIHLKFSLFIAQISDKLATLDNEIALGVSDIFDRPPTEALPIKEGFAGTQSQYACIICKLGYCFIDRQQGKVFISTSNGLDEISEKGMYNFFIDFSETSNKDIDNPFIGMGYTIGYNTIYNTLFICKQDTGGYNFTISYCPDLNQGKGGWVSFHDFRPNYFIFNRKGFYGIENTLFKVFRHNSDTYFCRYYDSVIKESYIDVVFNDSPETSKRFENVNWITTVEKNEVTYKGETATSLMVYNNSQCSGKISLQANPSLWYKRDVRNCEDTWNYNKFRDLINNVTLPFLDNKGDLIGSNINNSKSWFDKSVFISKFVIFRIINNNQGQKNFHISYVGSNLKKSDR